MKRLAFLLLSVFTGLNAHARIHKLGDFRDGTCGLQPRMLQLHPRKKFPTQRGRGAP